MVDLSLLARGSLALFKRTEFERAGLLPGTRVGNHKARQMMLNRILMKTLTRVNRKVLRRG